MHLTRESVFFYKVAPRIGLSFRCSQLVDIC